MTSQTQPATETQPATTFIVMASQAKMPLKCWGKYARCAVVEVEVDPATGAPARPRMISERARGVVRIVRTWERLFDGKTDRCAFARAEEEALTLRDELNSARA